MINGAGNDQSHSGGGACVKSDDADLVGVAHEQGVDASIGGILQPFSARFFILKQVLPGQ